MNSTDDNLYTSSELLHESGIHESGLAEAERRGLIERAGVADDTIALYDREALRRARHISALLQAGYAFDAIQRIVADVGFPWEKDRPSLRSRERVYLTVGELARRANLNVRTIKYWEERGIVTPQTRSEGGYRLYTLHYVLFCNLVRDLQNFGYNLDQIKEVSDLFRTFFQLHTDLGALPASDAGEQLETMQEKIGELFRRTAELKEGIERWEGLLNLKRSQVATMQKTVEKLLGDRDAPEDSDERDTDESEEGLAPITDDGARAPSSHA